VIDTPDRTLIAHLVTILAVAFVVYRLLIIATAQLRRLPTFESDPAAKARRLQRAETLRSILNNFIRIATLGAVAIMVLREFKIDVTPIIAGAGIVGIALGFGAQSLVRDYLAGAFIIIENQYDIGDQVTIANHTGTVEQITLRMTSLRDLDGGVHFIPNGKIDAVIVHAREWARATVDVVVPYTEDLSRVLTIVGEVSKAFADESPDMVLGPADVLGVDELGPNGPRIRTTVRTRPGQQAQAARDLRLRLIAGFDRAGIRFATASEAAPAEPAKPPES
jgi:moderate conductance mechanosensitive channel